MSRLQALLVDAKRGLAAWEKIPAVKLPGIAAQCGPEELAEIDARIAALQAELLTVEEWDGDTRVDIHLAIELFTELKRLAAGR